MARRTYKKRRKTTKKARSAAPARRRRSVAKRRTAPARRRRSNPRGFFANPVLPVAGSAVVGVVAGIAVDSMYPATLPGGLKYSTVAGVVVAGLAYKYGKGKTRANGVAAGLGIAASPAIPWATSQITGGMAQIAGGSSSDALTARRLTGGRVIAFKPQTSQANAALAYANKPARKAGGLK